MIPIKVGKRALLSAQWHDERRDEESMVLVGTTRHCFLKSPHSKAERLASFPSLQSDIVAYDRFGMSAN